MSRHLVSKLSELSNFYPPRNYQKIYGLSDSFRGNRRWLNRLSLLDIRSEVWGSRPQEFWKKTLLNILPKLQDFGLEWFDFGPLSLREKWTNTEFFLVRIFPHSD